MPELSEYLAPEVRRLKEGGGLIPGEPVSVLRQRLARGANAPALYSAHIGPSMNPTLCDLDLLEIVPYAGRPVRTGDVILLLPPEGEQPVVHRVLGVTPMGIRTQGDHNSQADSWLVQASDVVGRVVAARCARRRRAIAGGAVGQWVARAVRWGLAIDRAVSCLLYPLYLTLARRGPLCFLLPASRQLRVVDFGAGNGGRLRVMMGRRAIGAYDAERRQWAIRRPYRLFVDESILPGPPV